MEAATFSILSRFVIACCEKRVGEYCIDKNPYFNTKLNTLPLPLILRHNAKVTDLDTDKYHLKTQFILIITEQKQEKIYQRVIAVLQINLDNNVIWHSLTLY